MNDLWKSKEITNPNPQNKSSSTNQNLKKKRKKKTLEVFEGHPFTNTSGRGQTPNLSPQIHK